MNPCVATPESFPALVLNADFRPLSYYPLSLWSWQETVKAVFAKNQSARPAPLGPLAVASDAAHTARAAASAPPAIRGCHTPSWFSLAKPQSGRVFTSLPHAASMSPR